MTDGIEDAGKVVQFADYAGYGDPLIDVLPGQSVPVEVLVSSINFLADSLVDLQGRLHILEARLQEKSKEEAIDIQIHRAIQLRKAGIVTRDEARASIGLPPAVFKSSSPEGKQEPPKGNSPEVEDEPAEPDNDSEASV